LAWRLSFLPLASESGPREVDAVLTRAFALRGTDINGRDLDPARIDEVVTAGDTELWEVTNAGGSPHSFHAHDVQFRVLSVDGREPPRALRGPRDTIYAQPDATFRLVMGFTDPDFPYIFHCHVLQHEDAGMRGQSSWSDPASGWATPSGHRIGTAANDPGRPSLNGARGG
jgi:suppressor of ftsI